MTQVLSCFGRMSAVMAFLSFLLGCAGMQGTALAQTQNMDIPVLVVVDDSDPNSVRRSSNVHTRVLAQLSAGLRREGFRVVDEASVAADLGWDIKDRRSKAEILNLVDLMNSSGQANNRVRAMVMFRIFAQAEDLGGATEIHVRIEGDIYDIVANDFVDTFEMPRESYPAPAGCIRDELCLTETVGGHARDIAASMGVVLARKLDHYRSASNDGTAGSAGGSAAAAADGNGMITPYTVTIRYFDTREALTVIGIMADEFPGYSSHDLISNQPAIRTYEYVTTATSTKLDEWLNILLIDMGFDVDRDVEILISGTNIIIDKLVETDERPRSEDETSRFN